MIRDEIGAELYHFRRDTTAFARVGEPVLLDLPSEADGGLPWSNAGRAGGGDALPGSMRGAPVSWYGPRRQAIGRMKLVANRLDLASEPARNLELKVRCGNDDRRRIESLLHSQLMEAPLTLAQVDTYFAVPDGRLKVRTIETERGARTAELIAYHRPDRHGARWSSYTRVPLEPALAPEIIAALRDTVGMLTRVQKRRTVAHYQETRVHLDEVERLGSFVELETVLGGRTTGEAEADYATVVALLGLDTFEPVAGSYSDLMIEMLAVDNRPGEGGGG